MTLTAQLLSRLSHEPPAAQLAAVAELCEMLEECVEPELIELAREEIGVVQ